MTTTIAPSAPALLTWEAYMAEPETEGRYDIVEGRRIFMAGASYRHQIIAGNLYTAFRAFQKSTGIGTALFAPFDILIRRTPKLQTRQPDLLFVSHARVQQGGGVPEVGPLPFAPELTVEIISTSETERILSDKVVDYNAIGVSEVWVVRPDAGTIEVLTLTANGSQSVAIYSESDAVQSAAFPTLSVPVADVFAA